MKFNKIAFVLALAIAGAADARSTPGTDASRSEGGKAETAAPAPGPQTNAGGPDTVGSASRPYVSDFCFNWRNDPYCKAK